MKISCNLITSLLLLKVTLCTLVGARESVQHRKLITVPVGQAITERYIVVLNGKIADVVSKTKELLANSGATIDYEYNTVFSGFAVNGLVAKFLTIILDDDMVVSVEEDQFIVEDTDFKTAQSSPTNWGLDRIDQIKLPLDNTYGYTYTGKGVYIFVIDSGINLSHNEFGGRAECGYSAVSGEDCVDARGHGSHVSGIAGGGTVC
jgi:aqualysin 1